MVKGRNIAIPKTPFSPYKKSIILDITKTVIKMKINGYTRFPKSDVFKKRQNDIKVVRMIIITPNNIAINSREIFFNIYLFDLELGFIKFFLKTLTKSWIPAKNNAIPNAANK